MNAVSGRPIVFFALIISSYWAASAAMALPSMDQQESIVLCYDKANARRAAEEIRRFLNHSSKYLELLKVDSNGCDRLNDDSDGSTISIKIGRNICPVVYKVSVDDSMTREPALIMHTLCLCSDPKSLHDYWGKRNYFNKSAPAGRCVQRTRMRPTLRRLANDGVTNSGECNGSVGTVPVRYQLEYTLQYYSCDFEPKMSL